MIKINKLPKPSILEKNDIKWTEEYKKALEGKIELTTNISNRYNQIEIKDTLIKETYGKCAYCESKVRHISFADIEHILPKSRRPDLYVDWNNLTISCEVCNRINKKDYYSVAEPLINPITENPSDSILALGAVIFKKPGNRKGEITISILDLNRSSLLEKRSEKLHSFEQLVDKYVNESNPRIKEILKTQITQECSRESEYSFILTSFLDSVNINIT